MEALYFLKFWRSSRDHHRPSSVVDTDFEFNDEEEDDSFFELELTVPDFDTNNIPLDTDSNRFDNKNQNPQFETPSVSLSNSDSLSKRKILPIEPNSTSKPQSPISLLKSAPRFRVLMFKKSKSMAAHETAEKTGEKKQERKVFSVKFKLKEVANVAIFTRDNSLRRRISEESFSDDSSKLFSKEVMQKYLKLYVKVSRKRSEKTELSKVSPASSPATVLSGSPKKEKQGSIPAGIRVVCKHLGKSKSASSAATTVAPPATVARRDDSLVLQQDGIQSAILHCKKSFHSSSSRESSTDAEFIASITCLASGPHISLLQTVHLHLVLLLPSLLDHQH
ncbi:membrane-associated kinase regulator 5-like isoform X2 [Euphorbia lathyris]|uniref:membrane-associated kinase regulator 5-like isoform X2 n=1 Tax=Euphorbia lathyris TaxID=212925 RepID=UPI003313933A